MNNVSRVTLKGLGYVEVKDKKKKKADKAFADAENKGAKGKGTSVTEKHARGKDAAPTSAPAEAPTMVPQMQRAMMQQHIKSKEERALLMADLIAKFRQFEVGDAAFAPDSAPAPAQGEGEGGKRDIHFVSRYHGGMNAHHTRSKVAGAPTIYDALTSRYWFPALGSNNGANKCWLNAPMLAIFANDRIRNSILEFQMVQQNDAINLFKKCCQNSCIWHNDLYQELGFMIMEQYDEINDAMVFGNEFGLVDITCTFIIKELLKINIFLTLVETSKCDKTQLDESLEFGIGYVAATNLNINISNSASNNNAGHFLAGVPCTQAGCGYLVDALDSFRTNEHHKNLFRYMENQSSSIFIITDQHVVFNVEEHANNDFVEVCAYVCVYEYVCVCVCTH